MREDVTIIAVEGIDGSGKTTLIDNIREEYGEEFYYTSEPTDSWTSEPIERMNRLNFRNGAFFAFLMDRAYHLEVLPSYKPVISDRYIHSTLAYQPTILDLEGSMVHYNRHFVEDCCRMFPRPDCVIYLDVPVTVASERFEGEDVYEDPEFLQGVSERYMWALNQKRFHNDKAVIIDGTQTEEEIANEAFEALDDYAG